MQKVPGGSLQGRREGNFRPERRKRVSGAEVCKGAGRETSVYNIENSSSGRKLTRRQKKRSCALVSFKLGQLSCGCKQENMRHQRAVGGQRKMKRLYGLPQKAGLTDGEKRKNLRSVAKSRTDRKRADSRYSRSAKQYKEMENRRLQQ